MKYFLHDSSSFEDEKITMLFIKFGYEGLGLFYTILEKLAFQEKPVNTDVLKHQLKVGKKLEKCWNFMESIDIISSNNGETFNKQLLNFSEKYQIKKQKNAKRISEWRNNQEDRENVTRYESVRNSPKVNRSKVNRSKVNKDKEYIFLDPDFKDVFFSWLEYKKERKESYKSEKSIEMFYKKLLKFSNNSPEKAKEIIENSIANNWAGIFELKDENKQFYKSKNIPHDQDDFGSN